MMPQDFTQAPTSKKYIVLINGWAYMHHPPPPEFDTLEEATAAALELAERHGCGARVLQTAKRVILNPQAIDEAPDPSGTSFHPDREAR